ncbi:hypothetical protein SAMN05216389_112107 [Oceanobacillus limi]|uniref:Uncharacterized protein n=1 Tax=Oceanobacillus limi TaxID=930131 RepID=A0A1I0EUA0_9BACI|nr:hypothetical protein [Oceanobacillus limi]SET48979.1 hypothetical protein SAMN05216389_112107 [Oceanobacillus limi]
MATRILLRNPAVRGNSFRDYLLHLCSLPGEILVLSYGYFGENIGVDTDLKDSIKRGFLNLEESKKK